MTMILDRVTDERDEVVAMLIFEDAEVQKNWSWLTDEELRQCVTLLLKPSSLVSGEKPLYIAFHTGTVNVMSQMEFGEWRCDEVAADLEDYHRKELDELMRRQRGSLPFGLSLLKLMGVTPPCGCPPVLSRGRRRLLTSTSPPPSPKARTTTHDCL